MRADRLPLIALGLTLAGCAAHRPAPVALAAPPAVEAPPPGPPLPPGATPGMLVPQPLADGSFPTPNRDLAGDAAVWHLRSGLNVAALSCPGDEGVAIRAGYNGWLRRDKAPLGRVQARYAATYRALPTSGGYDEAMTRLYNFFSQTPVRPAFCTAAAGIVAEMAGVDAAALPAFAESRLVMLDRPFVDFYRAYDAWRSGAARPVVIAAAAPVALAAVLAPVPAAAPPTSSSAAPSRAVLAASAAPRRATLTLDLSSLPPDTAVTASR